MFKIFLNKKKSKDSVNKENNLNISLKDDNKILPQTDIVKNVNEYEQYVKEKKNSQTYRLSFNITPLCSNVLFNKITEVIYHEGGEDCVVFGKKRISGNTNNMDSLEKYCEYKNLTTKLTTKTLCRHDLIMDTGFSHPECGGLVYRCGYDIFNNHTLRKKEFNVVNKLGIYNQKYFNTIYDFKRDKDGYEIENVKDNLEKGEKTTSFYEHLYMYDNIHTFEDSINENLVEKNGWVGFINPTTLNIPNYGNVSLNKCMNNNKACEMIDMYPDRSLFSFVPKINKYRDNRKENNWDYCLTYPFSNFYDNELVSYKCKDETNINGLKAIIEEDIFVDDFIDYDDGSLITLKTIIKHNFTINSIVNIVLIGEVIENGKTIERIIPLENNEKVVRVGLNGKNKEYYFSIYADELFEKLNNFKHPSEVEIRVRKVINGGLCEYYFRKFRRIPNFNNSDVYVDDIISDKEIKDYSNKDFKSTLNALGFSKTIYSDNNAQLLFNDDVKLNGLKDNLGRDISEIYLTIIKNNDGHKEWYEGKDYTNSGITNSRCFGEVTSGVEMLGRDEVNYNIHVINNVSPDIINHNSGKTWNMINEYYYQNFFKVSQNENGKLEYISPKVLERGINKRGGIINGYEESNEFLGDIVEFNKGSLIENTLCDVLHRFNTVQRERLDEEYEDLIVDEIASDDYDLDIFTDGCFYGDEVIYNEIGNGEGGENEKLIKIPANIDAEGYYYKPHYKIELKQYKDSVKQGEHTRVAFSDYVDMGSKEYILITNKNYYFEILDKVYFYHKYTKEKLIGEVFKVGGKFKNEIYIKIELLKDTTINEYLIYRPNSEKPYGAYELEDGTGRYLWRDLLEEHEYDIDSDISKYIFTNNAHYINKHIVFKLHRQDPTGEYKLSAVNGPTPKINNFAIEGVTNDYSIFETMLNEMEEGGVLC